MKSVRLVEVSSGDDTVTILFASYLKEDFVERSVTFIIGTDRRLLELYFSSNDYGTAQWVNGRGIVDCHRWEDEDSVQSTSYLNRHYPALLQNGSMAAEYAETRIIPDVLRAVENDSLRAIVKTAVDDAGFAGIIDLAALGLM